MVEANRFAMCFLSVISFPLTFQWPKEELDFFPLTFLIAFQTILGLVFDVSEEQKLCQDVFFWVFIIFLAFAFSYLKASTFSAVGFRKSFRWAFFLSFIACLQTSFKPRYFLSLIHIWRCRRADPVWGSSGSVYRYFDWDCKPNYSKIPHF